MALKLVTQGLHLAYSAPATERASRPALVRVPSPPQSRVVRLTPRAIEVSALKDIWICKEVARQNPDDKGPTMHFAAIDAPVDPQDDPRFLAPYTRHGWRPLVKSGGIIMRLGKQCRIQPFDTLENIFRMSSESGPVPSHLRDSLKDVWKFIDDPLGLSR